MDKDTWTNGPHRLECWPCAWLLAQLCKCKGQATLVPGAPSSSEPAVTVTANGRNVMAWIVPRSMSVCLVAWTFER